MLERIWWHQKFQGPDPTFGVKYPFSHYICTVAKRKQHKHTKEAGRAWELPWTEEPGGLQSVGSKESGLGDQIVAAALKKCGFPRFSQGLPLSCQSV